MEKAVAYIRVSSQKQVDEGSSLESQEKHVKEYAASSELVLVRVFSEEGASAKTDQRPELQELLKFCLDRKNGISVVIVPKIDRLARNVNDYTNLKLKLSRMGVRLVSLGERLDDTPVGRFTETILASVAQFDNEIRAERSKGGMVDAVAAGRWVWKAPLGYRNIRFNGKGTIEPNPETAPKITKAYHLLASGHHSPRAVREFLIGEGLHLSKGGFYKLIQSDLYIGRIHGFGRVFDAKPPFIPLVDLVTFYKAQRAIERHVTHRGYQLESEDFPLRGTALCQCKKLFTASWSEGKTGKKYPYYRCPHCKSRSYARATFDAYFLSFLKIFKGNPTGWERLRSRLLIYSHERQNVENAQMAQAQARLAELHNLRDSVAMKNAMGVLPDDLAKRQIDRLTRDISACASTFPENQQVIDSNELVAFAERFFTSLSEAWDKLPLRMKKDLIRFMFPNGVLFHPDRGFRTLHNSLSERFMEAISAPQSTVVDPGSEISKELLEWLVGIQAIAGEEKATPPHSSPSLSSQDRHHR